jgi:hypothetical protein
MVKKKRGNLPRSQKASSIRRKKRRPPCGLIDIVAVDGRARYELEVREKVAGIECRCDSRSEKGAGEAQSIQCAEGGTMRSGSEGPSLLLLRSFLSTGHSSWAERRLIGEVEARRTGSWKGVIVEEVHREEGAVERRQSVQREEGGRQASGDEGRRVDASNLSR